MNNLTPLIGFSPSDGPFNLGHSLASAQNLGVGVYISFNGEILSQKEISRVIKEGGVAAIFQATPEPQHSNRVK